jgi:hypothetical protein
MMRAVTMLRHVLLGALLVAGGRTLGAQQAAPTTGVLIGVHRCEYVICDSLRTLLLVRQGETVRPVARADGLLVPRRDGFWWLGLENGFTGSGPADYDEAAVAAECDSIVLGLKKPPSDSVASDSTSEEEDVGGEEEATWPSAMWIARADATGTAPPHVLHTGGYGHLRLLWVGDTRFAMSEHAEWHGANERITEDYDEAIYRFADFLRAPGDSTPLQAWEPAGAAYRRAEHECRRPLLEEEKDADARAFLGDRMRTSWTVRRTPTAWQLAPLVQVDGMVTDEPSMPCDAPRGLGAAAIGHDRVTIAWSAIKDVLPGATTAFQSPAGDVLLVVQDSALHAFLPRDGRPGRPVARIPLGGDVVMAQWAVGAHAARWQRVVPALLAKGPPAFVADSTGRQGARRQDQARPLEEGERSNSISHR